MTQIGLKGVGMDKRTFLIGMLLHCLAMVALIGFSNGWGRVQLPENADLLTAEQSFNIVKHGKILASQKAGTLTKLDVLIGNRQFICNGSNDRNRYDGKFAIARWSCSEF